MNIFYWYLFLFCYSLQGAQVVVTQAQIPREFPTEQEPAKKVKLLPSHELQAEHTLEFMKAFGRFMHANPHEVADYDDYWRKLYDCGRKYGAAVINLPFVAPPVWTETQKDLNEGFTLLSYAAYSDRFSNKDFETLLHNFPGIDVNVRNTRKDYEGTTALMFAVGNSDKLEALLKRGADLFLKSKAGDSVFEYARHDTAKLKILSDYVLQQEVPGQNNPAIALVTRKILLYRLKNHLDPFINYIKEEEEHPTNAAVEEFDKVFTRNLFQVINALHDRGENAPDKSETPESTECASEQDQTNSTLHE